MLDKTYFFQVSFTKDELKEWKVNANGVIQGKSWRVSHIIDENGKVRTFSEALKDSKDADKTDLRSLVPEGGSVYVVRHYVLTPFRKLE